MPFGTTYGPAHRGSSTRRDRAQRSPPAALGRLEGRQRAQVSARASLMASANSNAGSKYRRTADWSPSDLARAAAPTSALARNRDRVSDPATIARSNHGDGRSRRTPIPARLS